MAPFGIKHQQQDLKNVIPIPAPMADEDDGKGFSSSSLPSSSSSSSSLSSSAKSGSNNNNSNIRSNNKSISHRRRRGGVPAGINSAAAPTATTASSSSSSSLRIGDRLSKAMEQVDLSYNRSPELIPLTLEYDKMKRNLRHLVTAVKVYQTKTVEMKESKTELAKRFAIMSIGSPLFDEIGRELDEEANAKLETAVQRSNQQGLTVNEVAEDYKKRCEAGLISLQGLCTFGSAQALCNGREYESLIVDYVVEWERLVTKLVDSERKRVRKLETDRRHYERKVDGLRQRESDLELKGKKSPTAQVEKLARNEQKLKEAFTVHEREAGRLCALLHASTHECYKDLYPLMKNYMKWEMNCVGRETVIVYQMSTILESMSNKRETDGSSTTKKTSAAAKKNTKPSYIMDSRKATERVDDLNDDAGDNQHK